MTITCATDNILHGYHRELVLKNIRFLIEEGADVICLQEAEVRFKGALRKLLGEKDLAGWEMHSGHGGFGGNVAILWKSGRLQLASTKLVRLPKPLIPSTLQHLQMRRLKKFDTNRVALVGTFKADGQIVQITSAHIAWEGGSRHRMRQIRHLREKRVEQALGPQYINALPRLSWSYDTSHADPGDGLGFLPKLHRAGVRFRARLDYIFATNVSVTSSAMHDLPGSDHRPLIAAFAVQAVPVVALVESTPAREPTSLKGVYPASRCWRGAKRSR